MPAENRETAARRNGNETILMITNMAIRRFKAILLAATIGTSAWYAWSVVSRSRQGTTGQFEGTGVVEESDAGFVCAGSRIFAGGTVEGAQREIPLRFEVAGRLKEIHVRAGDVIEKGSILAELDAELWELKFAEAGTLLKLARAERDRLVRAANSPLRKEDLTIADAKVALAEGTVRRERLMLDKTLLRAPTDGVVLRVQAEPGEMVGPEDNRDLFTLVNRSSTKVRACVEELDAMNVAVGQRAVIIADGMPNRQFTGVVETCSPFVAPKVQRHLKPGEMVDVRVREVLIELADGGELLIGLPVEVFIEPGQIQAEGTKRPIRYVPLRPTPQSELPAAGQQVRRSPSRAGWVESGPAGNGQQPGVQRTSVGEWRESPSGE
jgi:multidrug efflux pump subunit AcrA (membrane-fusion protein)